MILGATQTGKVGGGGGGNQQCTITLSPTGGTTPLTVSVTSTPDTAHIFWTKATGAPPDPTHVGDNPTGTTNRIGSSAGSINTGAGTKEIKVLAYAPGYLDSVIEEGAYDSGG